MRPVTFLGNSEVTFQRQNLGSLRACNNLLHNNSGLHSQMEEDGYLLIRGLINRETIIKARETILRYASEKWRFTIQTWQRAGGCGVQSGWTTGSYNG